MRRYNVLQAPLLSLGSPDFYRDLAANWRRIGARYLFTLILVGWVAMLLLVGSWLQLAKPVIDDVVDQLPRCQVRGGVMTMVDKPSPHRITIQIPDAPPVYMLFDTDNPDAKIEDLPNDVVMLATQKDLQLRKPQGNRMVVERHEWEQDGDFNPAELRPLIDAMFGYGVWFALPFLVLASFFYYLIRALCFALIGLIVCSVMDRSLGFGQLTRISVFATTPILAIETALWCLVMLKVPLGPLFGLWWLGAVFLSLVMTCWATFAVCSEPVAAPAPVAAPGYGPPPAPGSGGGGQVYQDEFGRQIDEYGEPIDPQGGAPLR